MSSDEYEKLPAKDREHFFQCPDCGEMFDFRILDDVAFHLAHHKPPRPAPSIPGPKLFPGRGEQV
jgi:hypothetical protein